MQQRPFGQPIVRSNFHANSRISISHTHTFGSALAFPEALPMGIDCEAIVDTSVDAILSQLVKAEKNLPFFGTENAAFTRLWTIKEALSKVLISGLLIPFEILEVDNLVENDQGGIISSFKYFKHYQGYSFTLGCTLFSFVYPLKATFVFDIQALQYRFKKYRLSRTCCGIEMMPRLG